MNEHKTHFVAWCRHEWPAIIWMGVWSLVIVLLIATLGW